MKENLGELEEKIGYTFKNKKLLRNALTHTSYSYQFGGKSYERLEYLGDSILEFISSEWLFKNYNNLTEGEMTKVRAATVCENSLFQIANKYNFSDFLFLGKSELTSHNIKKAILADSVEAVIAAIYLDSGMEQARKFIVDNLKDKIEYCSHHIGDKDYKTILQEKLQEEGNIKITYKTIKEEGPDHDKFFTVRLECEGKLLSYGKGKSKKLAEMEAAKLALEKLK